MKRIKANLQLEMAIFTSNKVAVKSTAKQNLTIVNNFHENVLFQLDLISQQELNQVRLKGHSQWRLRNQVWYISDPNKGFLDFSKLNNSSSKVVGRFTNFIWKRKTWSVPVIRKVFQEDFLCDSVWFSHNYVTVWKYNKKSNIASTNVMNPSY